MLDKTACVGYFTLVAYRLFDLNWPQSLDSFACRHVYPLLYLNDTIFFQKIKKKYLDKIPNLWYSGGVLKRHRKEAQNEQSVSRKRYETPL